MKFGKTLLRNMEFCDPEWGPFWLNYKLLKKKINVIIEAQGGLKVGDNVDQGQASKDAMRKSAAEVEFFRVLRCEVEKVSNFFTDSEKQCSMRMDRIKAGLHMLKTGVLMQDPNASKRLMEACTYLTHDLILLENFALLNSLAASKILKKHDKMTGFVTRGPYMQRMKNQNFTYFEEVAKITKETGLLFEEIAGLTPRGQQTVSGDARIFYDAIRGIHDHASRMNEQERHEDTFEAPSSAPSTTTTAATVAAASVSAAPSPNIIPMREVDASSASANPSSGITILNQPTSTTATITATTTTTTAAAALAALAVAAAATNETATTAAADEEDDDDCSSAENANLDVATAIATSASLRYKRRHMPDAQQMRDWVENSLEAHVVSGAEASNRSSSSSSSSSSHIVRCGEGNSSGSSCELGGGSCIFRSSAGPVRNASSGAAASNSTGAARVGTSDDIDKKEPERKKKRQ